jgi:hypothetical protein
MKVSWWHRLNIDTYWGPRAVSALQATELVRSFGARLATLDPLFTNLRALRSEGAELLNHQLASGAPSEDEADRLFAQLETRSFFLGELSVAELAAELAAQAPPENPGRFAIEFNTRPSGARYTAFLGEVHTASEPTPNRVGLKFPTRTHARPTAIFSSEFLTRQSEDGTRAPVGFKVFGTTPSMVTSHTRLIGCIGGLQASRRTPGQTQEETVSRAVGRPVFPMQAGRIWVGRWTFIRNIVPISSHFVLPTAGLRVDE